MVNHHSGPSRCGGGYFTNLTYLYVISKIIKILIYIYIYNSLKAKTMRDTLFGPVFLVAAYPYPLRSLILPIEMRED